MSHYPFALQAMMGMPAKERPPRTNKLTDDLEAVFGDVNWDHCENGSSNPSPRNGVSTLMGPATSVRAGVGSDWENGVPLAIKAAADILRADGYVIQIIPDNYEPRARQKEEDKSEEPPSKRQKKEDLELEYLRSDDYSFDNILIRKPSVSDASDGNDSEPPVVAKLSTMSLDTPWLVVHCTTPEIASSIQSLLQNDYALIELKHETKEASQEYNQFTEDLEDPDLYSIHITSGVAGGDERNSGIRPSTLFVLKRRDKTVAKALCTYSNGEMNSVGPTLELLEVAKQWRCHGLGFSLMEAVEHYYTNLCAPIISNKGRVLFSVCYVTNAHASTWFQEHCEFEDLDGMGEELGKYLV